MDQHTKWYIKFDITNILPLSQLYFFSFSSSTIFSLLTIQLQIYVLFCSVLLVSPRTFYYTQQANNIKFSMPHICTVHKMRYTDINLYTRQPFHIAPFTILYLQIQHHSHGKLAKQHCTNLAPIFSYFHFEIFLIACL